MMMVQVHCKEPHEGKTVTARALRITGDITSDITGDITSSVILREQNVVWFVAASFLSGRRLPQTSRPGGKAHQ